MTGTAGGAAPVLTRRALNRTTLARQAMLERAAVPALDMVGHLVAVQAQEPEAPYVGLWTRLEGFGHDELIGLLEDRRVVRSSVLRATQHLVTAADYLWLRPLVQPVLERVQRGTLGRRDAGVDPAELASATRGLLAGRTLTRPRLRGELRSFRDEAGRELLDLADAPLVDPDVPAPVRFLPEFDNLLLGHADRTRVLDDEHRGLVVAGQSAVLVDGFVRAVWTITRRPDAATLVIQALGDPLPAADRAAVTGEGMRLLGFAAADATCHDVQFTATTAGPYLTTASPGPGRGRS